MKTRPVLSMLGQLLVLLPAFFFAWYETLVWLVPLLADLLDPLLRLCWPSTFVKVQATGSKLVVVVRLAAEAVSTSATHKGVVLNPFSYAYGLPLFAALAIASTATRWQHLIRLLVGIVILIAGICFTIVTSLLFMFQFDAGFERLQLFGSQAANDTLVRYLHFLGFQMVPRVLPIALWILLYRDWIGELIWPAPRDEDASAGSPPPSAA